MIKLTPATVRLAAQARDKTEAIRIAGSLLVDSGNMQSGYIDSMLLREKGKPPAHPPTQSGTNQVLTGARSGNSSSIRLFRQFGSFSRVSRSHAAGSRPLRRAVPSRV